MVDNHQKFQLQSISWQTCMVNVSHFFGKESLFFITAATALMTFQILASTFLIQYISFWWQCYTRVHNMFTLICHFDFKLLFLSIRRGYIGPCWMMKLLFAKIVSGHYKCFENIYRKTPVLESHFNKVVGLRPGALLKRDSNTGVFLWIIKHLWWLLL